MEHRHDHPGNRPPGPHPSEEIPPSEVLAQRRAFLEISDADVERVRGLAGLFDSFLDGYVEQLFAHLVAHPVTASFLTDADLVACLKQVQKQYFESLLRARLDSDYVVDRQRIGQVHADVGLEPPWFLGAYNQYLQYTFRQFAAHCGGDLGCYVEGTLALLKLLLLDMGLALDPYFARSTEHLRTALRLLAQSNAEVKEFAHLASHDLKTPLATVANLCEGKYSVNPPASARRVPCPRPRPRLAVGSGIGIPRRNGTMRRGYDVSGAEPSSLHPHARLCSGLRFHGRNRSTSSIARPPAWAHASR